MFWLIFKNFIMAILIMYFGIAICITPLYLFIALVFYFKKFNRKNYD